MDCSPPDSSVYGILQERIIEWVAHGKYKGKKWTQWQILFCLSSKITADDTAAMLWEESYDKFRWCFKQQRYHFVDKGPYSQSYGFFQELCVDIFFMEEELRNWCDAFKLWCWRRLLRVPWTARRSEQSIWKEINPEYSLEGLMLKLKLPIVWPPHAKSWLTGKDPDAGKDWRQKEKEAAEDELVGWHHWLNGQESEQTPGDSGGQRSLACCSPWGWRESDTT